MAYTIYKVQLMRRLLHPLLAALMVIGLGACGHGKKKSDQPTPPAETLGAEDAAVADAETAEKLKVCIRDAAGNEENEDEADADEDQGDDAALSLKAKENKGKGKGKNKTSTDECNKTDATGGSTTGGSTTTSGTASLAEGQKIYAANCQSCHGALPGAKQGRSADAILGAASVGPHKSISPWPAGSASTLTAPLAAASLAMALR